MTAMGRVKTPSKEGDARRLGGGSGHGDILEDRDQGLGSAYSVWRASMGDVLECTEVSVSCAF
jgi:hypothetical protein